MGKDLGTGVLKEQNKKNASAVHFKTSCILINVANILTIEGVHLAPCDEPENQGAIIQAIPGV